MMSEQPKFMGMTGEGTEENPYRVHWRNWDGTWDNLDQQPCECTRKSPHNHYVDEYSRHWVMGE